MFAPLKAILFDMDGLMIDSERLARDAWLDTGRELSLPLTFEFFCSLTGLAVAGCQQRLNDSLGDPVLAAAALDRWRSRYRERIHDGGIPLKPGIIDILEWVKRQGLPCAVASSTQRSLLDSKLAQAGLAGYFAATVAGDEVACTKPAPDIYLAAAAALDVAPSECVALEDSPIGMRAALAAGIAVIQVPDLLEADEALAAQALAICPSLTDAINILNACMEQGKNLQTE